MNKKKYITERMLLNKELELAVMEFLFSLNIPLSTPRDFSSVEYSDRKHDLLNLYDSHIHAILHFCFVNDSLFFKLINLKVDDIVQGLKDYERYFHLYEMLFVIDTVINNIPEWYE